MREITIIDDDVDSRNLLQVFLRLNNFSVSIFSNAEEFISTSFVKTDLYIIDINLGGLSGIQVCEKLKTSPDSKSIPVIIISAHPEIEKLSRNVGADDFLTKPFSQNLLMEKINKFIARI